MPEMPEVQAHAERLDVALAGQRLEKFELLNFAALKTFDPTPKQLLSLRVLSITARGKYFVYNFEQEHVLVIHLMQGGRLKPEPIEKSKNKKPRFGLARFIFTTETSNPKQQLQSWLLTEAGKERKAGIWIIKGNSETSTPINRLGPDIHQISKSELTTLLAKQSKRLHGLLRKQSFIAGAGRLLANEICHRAKLSPYANSKKLQKPEVESLHKAIKFSIKMALKHERSLTEIGKSADRPSLVHNRKGELCLSCEEDTVRTVEYNQYTIFYCPNCQTNKKILADNTTSKFLK